MASLGMFTEKSTKGAKEEPGSNFYGAGAGAGSFIYVGAETEPGSIFYQGAGAGAGSSNGGAGHTLRVM